MVRVTRTLLTSGPRSTQTTEASPAIGAPSDVVHDSRSQASYSTG